MIQFILFKKLVQYCVNECTHAYLRTYILRSRWKIKNRDEKKNVDGENITVIIIKNNT